MAYKCILKINKNKKDLDKNASITNEEKEISDKQIIKKLLIYSDSYP